MKVKICLAVVLSILFASQAFAGWAIKEVMRGTEGEEDTRTVFFQNNQIKMVEADETSIFDLKNGIFYLLNPEQKIYCSGTPSTLQKSVEEASSKMMEAQMKELPPEQREAYKKAIEQMKLQESKETPADKLQVEVKKSPETITVAGFQGKRYQVLVNGKPTEDLWISKEINLNDEIDVDKSISFFKAMSEPRQEAFFEASPEYIELMKQGYAIKSTQYDEMGSIVTEVVEAQKKQIPESEFRAPQDYRKVSVQEFFTQKMQAAAEQP